VGNITSSAILVPKEVIKQRMQAGMVGSAGEVFIRTIRTEGVGGLYAGYSAALLRNLPSNIISFSTFVRTFWFQFTFLCYTRSMEIMKIWPILVLCSPGALSLFALSCPFTNWMCDPWLCEVLILFFLYAMDFT
jgi:hypothetical protein